MNGILKYKGFLVNITCRHKFFNGRVEFWPLDTRQKGASKLPGAKVATNHRAMNFFHGKLVESMPLRDD